ncbi:MAG: 23S rRNA pseudouridine synthase [Elusimicrobia bacterium]|nr:MAG: 23S rRNA pseudouridine synthase [Elusimicrobiota bacterium]KAF0156436.1 MAG: 23S rRNA pseudouridine synthase [Elusimicrobiota bacterium]
MENKKLVYSGAGTRLDLFVKTQEQDLSREFVKRLISEGLVRVNGRAVKPAAPLKTGDEVTISMPGEGKETPARLPGMLISEDAGIMAIDKPAGLCVHPTDSNWERDPRAALLGEETLISILAKERPELASVPRFGLVHRLDRETSGLILIARTAAAAEYFSGAFRDREISKLYIGAAAGDPESDAWTMDAPMGRPTGSRKIKVWEYGRDAVTNFKVLERAGKACLVDIRPETGRTNQIRVHISHAGHPIIGDAIYGGPPAARMLLHALRLQFPHPSTGRPTKIVCPVPDDFRKAWETVSGRPFKL